MNAAGIATAVTDTLANLCARIPRTTYLEVLEQIIDDCEMKAETVREEIKADEEGP